MILMAVGIYILVLVLSPKLPLPQIGQSTIDLNTKDDAEDDRNRIQISKMNLEVPFFEGGADSLDKGAWHRYPERGNPKDGGNFILSAHRFTIGLTPAETKLRSPFYKLDDLKAGDDVRIFYNHTWYDYQVTRLYDVKPDAVEIEAPSEDAKLTLYSCSLAGSADGRHVVEAHIRK
jgi:sortase A